MLVAVLHVSMAIISVYTLQSTYIRPLSRRLWMNPLSRERAVPPTAAKIVANRD